jgi:hypothetical protein
VRWVLCLFDDDDDDDGDGDGGDEEEENLFLGLHELYFVPDVK